MAISYILGVFFVKSVLFYIQKKRTENLAKDIDKLLDEHFLFKLKMNCKKYPTNNYIPTRPKLLNDHDRFGLDAQLQQILLTKLCKILTF